MTEQYELILERGAKGLGFNIIGGSDIPKSRGDFSIYVSKIKPEGAASVDGRLQVGDKILTLNGNSLQNVKHQEAVNLFINSGSTVKMNIEKKPAGASSGGGIGLVLKFVLPAIIIGAAIATAVIILKKKS